MNPLLYLQMLLQSMNQRWDDKFTAVLQKQLEYVKTKTYDIVYPEKKARRLIPVSNEIDPGAESMVYRQWDEFGAAVVIANYADDLPLVDVMVEEFTVKIQSLGQAYQWSIQDLRRSAMSGAMLDSRRARAARRAIENKIDDIAAAGLASGGLKGFVNHPNVTLVAPITGSWASASALQILADLDHLVTSIIETNKETFMPDTLVLPYSLFKIISTKPMSVDNTTTVLQTFLKNSTHIRNVETWYKLDNADAAGTGPRIVCYKRDPEVLTLEIPQEFEQFPPQARNLSFVVPCHARIGGVVIYYPLAMAYMDGC